MIDRAARHFIAGKQREDAIRIGKELNSEGFGVVFNYIGDHTDRPESRDAAFEEYFWLLENIHASGMDAGISPKASSLGQFSRMMHPGKTRRKFDELMQKAAEYRIPAWLDGEELCWKQKTNALIRDTQPILPLGKVLQAYDIGVFEELENEFLHTGRTYRFRICRGAYNEPEDAVYRDEEHVRYRMKTLINRLIGSHYLQIATHHFSTIWTALRHVEYKEGVDKTSFEIAMLYGYDMALAHEIMRMGYRVVLYVPYGEDVEGYVIRRIIERPKYLLLPVAALLRAFR